MWLDKIHLENPSSLRSWGHITQLIMRVMSHHIQFPGLGVKSWGPTPEKAYKEVCYKTLITCFKTIYLVLFWLLIKLKCYYVSSVLGLKTLFPKC